MRAICHSIYVLVLRQLAVCIIYTWAEETNSAMETECELLEMHQGAYPFAAHTTFQSTSYILAYPFAAHATFQSTGYILAYPFAAHATFQSTGYILAYPFAAHATFQSTGYILAGCSEG